MSASPKPQPAGRRTAFVVLALGLAATLFSFCCVRELARTNQIMRWRDGFTQMQPVLGPAIAQRFQTLFDQARAALRHDDFSQAGWDNFTGNSEWMQRFPGMQEVGYAELAGDKCIVKFLASRQPAPIHAPGFDLNSNADLRAAVEQSATAGYGVPAREIRLGEGTNAETVVVGFMPVQVRNAPPGTASENRANLRGFFFFALNQAAYFHSFDNKLKDLPFTVRLLAPAEIAPPRTATQREFSNGSAAGEWRFFAQMKAASTVSRLPQWIVLAVGTALSVLMFSLVSTQTKMRWQAEIAGAEILRQKSEMMALNRDLEAKIAARTEELNVALAEEKELNRLKSNFISMVTHEIRTPLAIILGSSEILSRYLDRILPARRAVHLGKIDDAVQRMSDLLEDVLLFSKAEAGRMEFNPVELNLQGFCTQLVDELRSATNRRCPIELSVEAGGLVRGDENLLRHIFSNLISNAVKYSPPGTPVKFSVRRDGGDAIFTVQDRGLGIPEADRKRLFTPFHRSKNVIAIQGTGLGLVIVKHCIERHGGSIGVDSTENAGTTVSVRLPLFSPAHTEFIKRIPGQTTNEKNPGN